jgi:hypothetical protein
MDRKRETHTHERIGYQTDKNSDRVAERQAEMHEDI